MHEWPVHAVSLNTSLTEDGPYLNTDASLVLDGRETTH